MNRMDRLLAIIVMLQSQKIVTGQEIASHFKISLRTVYRDISAICEAGIPVAAEAGIGYSIIPGYHLPPVMFTENEASALYMASLLTRKFSDKSIEEPITSALQKILAVLPHATKEKLAHLKENIQVLKTQRHTGQFKEDVILTVQEAIVNKNVLVLNYFVASKNRYNKREIEPLALIHYANQWHIIAFCRLRNALRDFRTDRIETLHQTEKKFTTTRKAELQVFYNHFRHSRNNLIVEIQIQSHKAHIFLDALPVISKLEKCNDSYFIHFPTDNLNWLVPLFLRAGQAVHIINPPELKSLLAQKSADLAKYFK